ncbi:MAG: DNA (cytosine-5-)-methyltransferase, partial [Acidobacteria bacterium]|nr:DNA (cytosine-5-)-methyltransferase [Acidobacteriota bacterium]
MRKYTFIDLFCGAGGLAEGFRQAGFESVFAVEIDKAAAATYEANFHHPVFTKPIEQLRRVPVTADLVIGGPPCQGFSPLGRFTPSKEQETNHIRMNALWRHFLTVVKRVQPLAFVMENVPEFLRSAEFPRVKRAAEKLGYLIAADVLRAVDFGVPQCRRRGFILGTRGFIPALPQRTGER